MRFSSTITTILKTTTRAGHTSRDVSHNTYRPLFLAQLTNSYFVSTCVASTGFFGYPDVNESKFYCQMFRLSLVGFCGLFIMMHLTAAACFLTTHANSHRESEVLEPLESMQERWANVSHCLDVIASN